MLSKSSNHESFLPAMDAIAREAGAVLIDYFHQHLKVEYKGDADLVTAADRASEVLIRERITQQWPSHDVLGEEQGLNDQVLQILRGKDFVRANNEEYNILRLVAQPIHLKACVRQLRHRGGEGIEDGKAF